MWNLNTIPKVVHFYWGGKKCSFLQFMTVYSFWQLNPDWTIKIHTSIEQNKSISWNTKEQDYKDNYEDFTSRLGEIPVKFVYHNLGQYGLPNMTEVHKSDILRLKLLSEEGGLYSDLDILFIKPLDALECNKIENASKDTFVSICHYGHSIGFLMSSPNNAYYGDLYSIAYSRVISGGANGYQDLGAPMINSKYRDINAIPGNVYNFTMDTVYPFDAQHIPAMFTDTNMNSITPNTVGIHWYAGHPMAGEYLNKTNGGLSNLPPCVITSLLYTKQNYTNTKISLPKQYTSSKIFLYGISGTGKTTYAKNYSSTYDTRYFDFDLYFGIVNKGWTDKYGADKFFNMLPDSFITEFTTPDIAKFLEYAKDKDIQVVVCDCSNKVEHKQRLDAKNISLTSLEVNTNVVEQFKNAGIKVDYYDSRTI